MSLFICHCLAPVFEVAAVNLVQHKPYMLAEADQYCAK